MRRRARRILILVGVAIGAVALGRGDVEAKHRIHIQVANCGLPNESTLKFYIYNGNDSGCDIKRSEKQIEPGDMADAHCRGRGKGRCRVRVLVHATRTACFNVHSEEVLSARDTGTKILHVSDDFSQCHTLRQE